MDGVVGGLRVGDFGDAGSSNDDAGVAVPGGEDARAAGFQGEGRGVAAAGEGVQDEGDGELSIGLSARSSRRRPGLGRAAPTTAACRAVLDRAPHPHQLARRHRHRATDSAGPCVRGHARGRVGLRSVRDIDISGDVSAVRPYGPGHRRQPARGSGVGTSVPRRRPRPPPPDRPPHRGRPLRSGDGRWGAAPARTSHGFSDRSGLHESGHDGLSRARPLWRMPSGFTGPGSVLHSSLSALCRGHPMPDRSTASSRPGSAGRTSL